MAATPRHASHSRLSRCSHWLCGLGATALLLGLTLVGMAPRRDATRAGEPKPAPKVGKTVDVVFVLDATGSMDAVLKNTRDAMAKFAAQLESAGMDARYAAAIYRDRVDDVGNKPEDPFVLKVDGAEFTKDAALLAKAVSEVKAEGGGDVQESAFDALDFASKLPFRKDVRPILILVTDAPPRIPDKDIKDETQLAKILLERGVDQLHVLHDLEPERYKKLQELIAKPGRFTPLHPTSVEKMQAALTEIGGDIIGGEKTKTPPPVVTIGPGKVDVVFVVDTTGSMGGDIAALKDSMARFGKVFKDAKADAQFGLVTFKDRVEDPPETRDPKVTMFDGKEFSADSDRVAMEIGKLNADGGGDEPESGLDALDFAARRPFRPGARKVLILVTDAAPRVPDKDMKDEDQVHASFKSHGIDQFHLVARGGMERYVRLNSLVGRGKVVNLAKGDDFANGVEAIGKDAASGLKEGIALTTNKVDIVLVLDATGTMEPHIKGVTENVHKLLANLTGKKIDTRIGVTIFRDAVDTVANTPEDPMALKFGKSGEFTKSAKVLEKMLGTVVAKDGGDLPESSFDALDFASRREFRPDAARVLLLVTDGPPRIPDKKMKDERDTAEALKANGIHQLHLITPLDIKPFEEVQRLISKGGGSAGLKFRIDGGRNFEQMFNEISDGIIARLGPVEPPPAVASTTNKVDIVFVLDTTGSMGGDLTAFRDNLMGLVNTLKAGKADFQIGMVTFKDRVEDPPETRDPKVIMIGDKEFSNDGERLLKAAGDLNADGGGDLPESGLDALDFASRRAFRKDARKVLVLVSDAPPRIPDKDMKDEKQVAQLFKERGIDQLHLIVRGESQKYEDLVKLHGKGKVTHMDRGPDFKAGMEMVAKESMSGAVAGIQKLDLVLILDTTGSMDAHIKSVRDHVRSFAQVLKDSKIDFQIGVVTFTDRVDDPPPNNEHKALIFGGDKEFTKDAEEISREVGKLNAFGGGDAPESGFDAIEFASRRPFRTDARKVLLLITDDGPRVPDKDMKDENQVIDLLKKRGIEAMHMMVGNNSELYVKIGRSLPKEGKIIDLNRFGGDNFKPSFEDVARATISGSGVGGDRSLPIAGTKVDLVFVIDTTGSMGDFNGNLLQPAERMINKLKAEKVDFRVGMVEFKDRHPGDGNNVFDHRVVPLDGRDFSGNFEEFRRAVGTLKADGGGDAPESSLDALAFAAKRDFRFDALKVVVLITDEGPKVPDKDMRDENDVLRVFKDKGVHQFHMIAGNSMERYQTLQRLMGRDAKTSGKMARIGDRGGDQFNKDVDSFTVAILEQLRTEGRIKLTDRPLAPLTLAKNEKGQAQVDVVFVVDATASMGPEIAWVRDGGPKILKRLQDLNFDARLGLTFFRDRVDNVGNVPEDPKALMFLDNEFTSDGAAFSKEVATLKARDGGDVEESSLDGIEFASRRSFRKGAYKVLILVTDAPPRLPDKDMKDEFQLGELLRERGIHQLHLLLKTEPHRYATLQRFLTGDGSPAGLQFDLNTITRGDRSLERLMDSVSRSIAGESRRALDRMAKGDGK